MKNRGSSKALEDLPEPQQDDLRFRCEVAKCSLAGATEAHFGLFGYDGIDEQVVLTRDGCKRAVEPSVTAALDLLAETISRARRSTDSIDEIIIIGGCSQLWLFREMLRNDHRFRSRYILAESPEWDVARGAAVVQRNPGCFVLAESLALQLSDGAYFDLVRPGDHSGSAKGTVSLALVEDAASANIIIERKSEHGNERETALQFSVPTQGFDLEEIRLDYLLTEDLTFHVSGRSLARTKASKQERETGELRFRYSIDGMP